MHTRICTVCGLQRMQACMLALSSLEHRSGNIAQTSLIIACCCSKKISMAVGTQLGCIAWDQKAGYLCCGGDAGLLKVIQMAASSKGKLSTFTLDEHVKNECKVTACCWNERYKKLTSSDESGHIIVWMEDHHAWQVEMVNNRGTSTVADMGWACDGSRICIAYHDGAVIVGTVGGSRVWGKSLDLPLKLLAWSPTCQHILFATRDSRVYVYDADGNQASELRLKCLEEHGTSNIAVLTWCVLSSLNCLLPANMASICAGYVMG